MALTKLGKYIKQSDARNGDGIYTLDNLKGISIQKCFIESKADMEGVSLKPYLLVPHDHFAYVLTTSRNGEKITLAHNKTDDTYIVSSSYIVFYVSDTENLLPDYLFMYFNRPEFDRYARFNSWGSARETFNWDDLCDMDVELPSMDEQKRVATVYTAMKANQEAYERGLDDLKLVCDAYIDNLRRDLPRKAIGDYIEQSDERNGDKYGIHALRGISIQKRFIDSKADMEGVSLSPYLLVSPDSFAYVTVTSRNGEKITLANNATKDTYIVSSSYEVFRVKDKKKLLPAYLMLFLSRLEFDRYTRFHSWGSARETFGFDDMQAVKIPIPDIGIQQAIAGIYNAYLVRREINERLKKQIADICPILIKGSLQAA
jgi:type I restriction enzyme S subunit